MLKLWECSTAVDKGGMPCCRYVERKERKGLDLAEVRQSKVRMHPPGTSQSERRGAKSPVALFSQSLGELGPEQHEPARLLSFTGSSRPTERRRFIAAECRVPRRRRPLRRRCWWRTLSNVEARHVRLSASQHSLPRSSSGLPAPFAPSLPPRPFPFERAVEAAACAMWHGQVGSRQTAVPSPHLSVGWPGQFRRASPGSCNVRIRCATPSFLTPGPGTPPRFRCFWKQSQRSLDARTAALAFLQRGPSTALAWVAI